ncbi:RNA polymerase sigma-70 factor, ECF subfamily [bacterium A37T11]|nr:RNA polymerase sigma-70 factor, ECF subfamily [bacterium A37T11]
MQTTDTPDEKDTLHRLREGDYAAFNLIYDTYKRQLAKNLLRLLKDNDMADEALQDLFMKLWENREKIDPEQPIKAYLFRIAENLVYDRFRKASRDKEMRKHFLNTATELYSHIEEKLFDAENRTLLYKAIDQLPPKRREVVILCKIDGLSYEEAAQQLGVSVNAINDHIKKANAFFKQYFNPNTGLGLIVLVSAILQGI